MKLELEAYLAGKGDTNSNGVKAFDNESWRSSELLGFLLCSTKDNFHCIHLGNIAFSNLKKYGYKESVFHFPTAENLIL